MGLQSLSQGSRIRAWNGEGWAGSRCGVLETETKVCGGTGYTVEILDRAWAVETHGLELRCSVTRSVTLCIDSINCRNKNGLLGEPINYDKDGVETRG